MQTSSLFMFLGLSALIRLYPGKLIDHRQCDKSCVNMFLINNDIKPMYGSENLQ